MKKTFKFNQDGIAFEMTIEGNPNSDNFNEYAQTVIRQTLDYLKDRLEQANPDYFFCCGNCGLELCLDKVAFEDGQNVTNAQDECICEDCASKISHCERTAECECEDCKDEKDMQHTYDSL